MPEVQAHEPNVVFTERINSLQQALQVSGNRDNLGLNYSAMASDLDVIHAQTSHSAFTAEIKPEQLATIASGINTLITMVASANATNKYGTNEGYWDGIDSDTASKTNGPASKEPDRKRQILSVEPALDLAVKLAPQLRAELDRQAKSGANLQDSEIKKLFDTVATFYFNGQSRFLPTKYEIRQRQQGGIMFRDEKSRDPQAEKNLARDFEHKLEFILGGVLEGNVKIAGITTGQATWSNLFYEDSKGQNLISDPAAIEWRLSLLSIGSMRNENKHKFLRAIFGKSDIQKLLTNNLEKLGSGGLKHLSNLVRHIQISDIAPLKPWGQSEAELQKDPIYQIHLKAAESAKQFAKNSIESISKRQQAKIS